jgi:hypothetical protein
MSTSADTSYSLIDTSHLSIDTSGSPIDIGTGCLPLPLSILLSLPELPPPWQIGQSNKFNIFYSNQSSVITQIFIGHGAKIINWRSVSGNWRAASGNTCRNSVCKNVKRFKWALKNLKGPTQI